MFDSSKDCGWKFPVRVDTSTGKIMMSQGEEDIHEAIIIILKTSIMERKKRPDFGSELSKYVFDLGGTGTMTLIEEQLKEAIENWEPRVTDVEVYANYDGQIQERIVVDVSYSIKSLGRSYQKSISIDV